MPACCYPSLHHDQSLVPSPRLYIKLNPRTPITSPSTALVTARTLGMKNIKRKDNDPPVQGKSRHQFLRKQASSQRSGSCHTSTALVPRSSLLGISATVLLLLCSGIDVVIIEDFGVPALVSDPSPSQIIDITYIMIFHVSTGRSASLNDQSNFSSALGSSVGSW